MDGIYIEVIQVHICLLRPGRAATKGSTDKEFEMNNVIEHFL